MGPDQFSRRHVRAFAHFGGAPARVAYDNLRAAVVRILVGGKRTLTRAVHRALVPISRAATLSAINDTLLARMDARLDSKRHAAGLMIGARFARRRVTCA